jgi:hypothetical protein
MLTINMVNLNLDLQVIQRPLVLRGQWRVEGRGSGLKSAQDPLIELGSLGRRVGELDGLGPIEDCGTVFEDKG